jgi:hypothetical protein
MLTLIVCTALAALTSLQDRRVAVLPEGVEAGPIAFAADGSFAAYCVREGESFRLVVGDWRSRPSSGPIFPVLSKRGPEVFYAIHTERYVFQIFDRDRALFEVRMDADTGLGIPGVPSGDGKVLAPTSRNARTGVSAVLLNGKVQKSYKGEISSPVLSDDGSVVAFALENDDGHRVVVNDVSGPVYDFVTSPVLSADGKTVAYGAELDGKAFLVHGERKIPLPQPALGVFMTPDGKSLGYWRAVKRADGKKCAQVIVGKATGPELADIQAPSFHPGGKHWTYRGESLAKFPCVIINNRLIEAPGLQGMPTFTDEGRKVGYGIRQGRDLVWKTVELK